jgi:archaetidylinositol phosphate synthase
MFEKFRDKIEPVIAFFVKYISWIHPNVLSTMGLFLNFIPAYFFIKGKLTFAALGILVAIFDSLDGGVARLTGKVSKFGEVFDASLDRISDAIIIFGIAQGGYISWYMAFIVMIGFYMVSYVRARAGEASAKKVKLNVGIAQRGDRILILFLATLFFQDDINLPFIDTNVNLLEIAFVILGVLTWVTVIQRFVASYKRLRTADGKQQAADS